MLDTDLKELALTPEATPLQLSHEVNAIEAELKALLLDVFNSKQAESFFNANVAAVPFLGGLSIIRQAIVRDGLSVVRSIDNQAMSHFLLKAWLGKNHQNRGLYFYQSYLNMIYPKAVEMYQQWQDKNMSYPNGLLEQDNGNAYLTSRVLTKINLGAIEDELDVSIDNLVTASSTATHILPARLVPIFDFYIDFCGKPKKQITQNFVGKALNFNGETILSVSDCLSAKQICHAQSMQTMQDYRAITVQKSVNAKSFASSAYKAIVTDNRSCTVTKTAYAVVKTNARPNLFFTMTDVRRVS